MEWEMNGIYNGFAMVVERRHDGGKNRGGEEVLNRTRFKGGGNFKLNMVEMMDGEV